MIRRNNAPPAYKQHPVVVRSLPRRAIPVSIYLDGVVYNSRSDTVLGFFLVNEVSQERHLLCCLRKADQCRCGCGGWCTVWSIFAFIHWSLRALSLGVYPDRRHDGQPFGARDEQRSRMASRSLGLLAAPLYLKADLAEFAPLRTLTLASSVGAASLH